MEEKKLLFSANEAAVALKIKGKRIARALNDLKIKFVGQKIDLHGIKVVLWSLNEIVDNDAAIQFFISVKPDLNKETIYSSLKNIIEKTEKETFIPW